MCSFCCCCYAAFVFVLIVVVVVGCVSFAASSQRVLAGTDVAASIWGTTVVVAPIDEQLRLTKTNFTSNRSNSFVFNQILVAVLPSFLIIIFTLRTRGSLAQRFNSYLLELKNEPSVGHQSLGS